MIAWSENKQTFLHNKIKASNQVTIGFSLCPIGWKSGTSFIDIEQSKAKPTQGKTSSITFSHTAVDNKRPFLELNTELNSSDHWR